MTVDIQPWALPGCWLVRTALHRDARGTFRKIFQRSLFAEHGFPVDWGEQFFTLSSRDVIRGLHLQLPPSGQWKLVSCLTGSVLDAAVDLRVDSPTYGEHATQALTQDANEALLLPPGVAHGFLATSESCLMAYSVTAEHDGARDGGVRWDSADITWPVSRPVISTRDAALPRLEDFASPFTMSGGS